jgi:hypothetical protein
MGGTTASHVEHGSAVLLGYVPVGYRSGYRTNLTPRSSITGTAPRDAAIVPQHWFLPMRTGSMGRREGDMP